MGLFTFSGSTSLLKATPDCSVGMAVNMGGAVAVFPVSLPDSLQERRRQQKKRLEQSRILFMR
jgi:hypothetical protein